MRYRALDSQGDYQLGRGPTSFLVNTPACVGQLVATRLRLMQGEWFLDVTEGTPYGEQVLGANTQATRDAAIRQRVLQAPGVIGIADYVSKLDPATRKFTVTITIDTLFGRTALDGGGNFVGNTFTWDSFTWDAGRSWGQ